LWLQQNYSLAKMVDINTFNFLRIGYHIIRKENNQDFYYDTFELLKKLPMNYLQLENPTKYYLTISNSFPKIGYFLHNCVLDKIQPDLVNDIGNQCLINFFFIEENVDYDLLKDYFSPNLLRYKLIQNEFGTVNEILELFKIDDALIKNTIQERFADFKLDEWQNGVENNKTYFKYNSFQNNNVGENNYYLLNHMIGDYWTLNFSGFQTEEHLAGESNLSKLILQAKTIDTVEAKIYSDARKKLPSLTSVILVVPYQKDNKYEQDFSYNFKPEINEADIAKFKRYFRGLDDIVFHQAAPTFSPVIRTPFVKFENLSTLHDIEDKYDKKKKNQIKKITEKFEKDVGSNYYDDNKVYILTAKFIEEKNLILNKIHKECSKEMAIAIKNFGEILTKKVLNKDLKEYIEHIKVQGGQLVTVSDLPIEYMQLDGLPISLTHDICRIYEDEMRKGYDLSKYNDLVINETLIEKTLVIFLDIEDDIISGFYNKMAEKKERIDQLYNCSIDLRACNSIDEIKQAVSNCNPTLLIFYCHGSYENEESVLVVNENENLCSNDIIKHEIKADLVILCACNTSPIISYKKNIANAFLQAGSLSVTATYNSINAGFAGLFISLLLVEIADYKNINLKNWLQFISSNLRSSIIFYMSDIPKNDKIEILELYDNRQYKEVIERYLNLMQKSNPKIKDFWDLDIEWMHYTILGRADLIYFESYIQRYWKMHS